MDITLKAPTVKPHTAIGTGLVAALFMVITVALAPAALAGEEYYTWIDENGVTNYASKKPRGYEAAFVAEGEKPFGFRAPEEGSDVDAGRPGRTTPDIQVNGGTINPEKMIAEEKAKMEAKLAEDRAYNCDVGKRNLTRLEAFDRVEIRGEDGELRLMTEAEKEEKRAASRKLISENCNA